MVMEDLTCRNNIHDSRRVIVVDKNSDALDVRLVSLVTMEDEGLGDLQSSGLVFVLVFHHCGAPSVNV
jgi:hypothetical protein